MNLLDHIDQLCALTEGSPVYQLRHQRDKVVAATQASEQSLFDPSLDGLSLAERLEVACHACRLTPSLPLAAHYQAELDKLPKQLSGARLSALLEFTRVLILKPIEGDQAALQALLDAGISTSAIVTLAQLIGFVSYQVRLLAGVLALKQVLHGREATAGQVLPSSPSAAIRPQPPSIPADIKIIQIQGFTNETLGWRAWLDKVDVAKASPEQIEVLEESHPSAKQSDYYLSLVHQPAVLRQRSIAFNAIMYAPGGLSRAERELASTVVSRINGCVYCASVHAQRFEQMAKRQDVIEQVFQDPYLAGTNAREKAIVELSIALTLAPADLKAKDIEKLQALGLKDLEILDLVHSIAIFAWANRLMLNLGEPVFKA